MKTKQFLLATAGSTVDGRNIDEAMIEQMASSYDPKTYGARLNIEHIRGISPEMPFRAYGDVLELSVGEVEVNFNGKKEKRKGLYGVFDVTDDAKTINEQGQKVYPSIEIEPNFAGKGFAYLMGCALTDSPAAIATDRLQFNRAVPGTIQVTAEASGIDAALLEFADEKTDITEGGAGFLKGLEGILGNFAARFAPEKKPEPKADPSPQNFDMSALTGLFSEFGKQVEGALAQTSKVMTEKVDALETQFTTLKDEVEKTANPNHNKRPASNGNGEYAKTDC